MARNLKTVAEAVQYLRDISSKKDNNKREMERQIQADLQRERTFVQQKQQEIERGNQALKEFHRSREQRERERQQEKDERGRRARENFIRQLDQKIQAKQSEG